MGNDFIGNDATATLPVQDGGAGAGGPALDYHGSGLVYLEYARLVQNYLSQFAPAGSARTLGDPNCLEPNVKLLPGTGLPDPSAPLPAGCTGFEGIATFAGTAATAGDPAGIVGSRVRLLDDPRREAHRRRGCDHGHGRHGLQLGLRSR